MTIAILNVFVGMLLAFGGLQEAVVRGIFGREAGPLLVGAAGDAIGLLLVLSGIALIREWRTARRLVVGASLLSIAFHVLAALPPHRNVGMLALLIGAGYPLVVLLVLRRAPSSGATA